MMRQERILHTTVGFPGSGKTRFAEQLAQKIDAKHLNSDTIRAELFGDRITESYNKEGNRLVFGEMTERMLFHLHDRSVIFDANNNTVEQRLDKQRLAQSMGVRTVVIYMQTPYEIAKVRAEELGRSVSRVQVPQKAFENLVANLEPPHAEKEQAVLIDGTKPFDQQLSDYQEQMELLRVSTQG